MSFPHQSAYLLQSRLLSFVRHTLSFIERFSLSLHIIWNENLGYDSNKPVRAILLLNVLHSWQTNRLLSLSWYTANSALFSMLAMAVMIANQKRAILPLAFSILADYMVFEPWELWTLLHQYRHVARMTSNHERAFLLLDFGTIAIHWLLSHCYLLNWLLHLPILAVPVRSRYILLQGSIKSWRAEKDQLVRFEKDQQAGLGALIEGLWIELLDSWCYSVAHLKWVWKGLSSGQHCTATVLFLDSSCTLLCLWDGRVGLAMPNNNVYLLCGDELFGRLWKQQT